MTKIRREINGTLTAKSHNGRMLMSVASVLVYFVMVVAAVGICIPFKPFSNRQTATFAAFAAFVTLGLMTPLKEPLQDLSYFEWTVAKQKCLREGRRVGPCKIEGEQVASFPELQPLSQ